MAAKHLTIPDLSEQEIAHFWSRVNKSDPSDCWEWTACKDGRLYGKVGFRRRVYKSHRIAYWLEHDDFDDELFVLHSCDNPPCCNPRHLFQGTQLDNVRDMHRKGRANTARGDRHKVHVHPELIQRGEENGLSKLKTSDVIEARKLHATGLYSYCELARKFMVANTVIRKAIIRTTWKHVP